MSYKEYIIDAIKLHRKGTINGPHISTISEHVKANFPSDEKWNGTILVVELRKMKHDGDLVQLEFMHYNFSTDFEKNHLEKEAAAAEQKRLKFEAAGTKLEEEAKVPDELNRLKNELPKESN